MNLAILICLAVSAFLITCLGLIRMHCINKFGADLEEAYREPLVDLRKYK